MGTRRKTKNPELPDDLQVHKPYIDEVDVRLAVREGCADAPRARGDRLLVRLRRDAVRAVGLSEPHARQRANICKSQFPADFISEAIDQTRGWFYSQLAISTLLFGEARKRGTLTS